MKRLFIGLMVLGLGLCLAVGASAAKGTVPKQLCLFNNLGGIDQLPTAGTVNVLSLAPKMSGTIKLANGPVKYYNITGEVTGATYTFPVAGSGRLLGSIFHFTITGFVYLSGWTIPYEYQAEGFYTLGAASATVTFHYVEKNYATNWTFTVIDCSTVALPYNAEETLGRE